MKIKVSWRGWQAHNSMRTPWHLNTFLVLDESRIVVSSIGLHRGYETKTFRSLGDPQDLPDLDSSIPFRGTWESELEATEGHQKIVEEVEKWLIATTKPFKTKPSQLHQLRMILRDDSFYNPIWEDEELVAFLERANLAPEGPTESQIIHLAASLAFTELTYNPLKAKEWIPRSTKLTVWDFEQLAEYQKHLGQQD